MTWTPYSLEEVANLLDTERREFTADEQAKFARVKVPVRKVRCHRGDERSGDCLFVVADDGETAVVFDDVDQEFGICKSSALGGDIVRHWSLAGSLVFALMHLKK
jgi:hypothetical protein